MLCSWYNHVQTASCTKRLKTHFKSRRPSIVINMIRFRLHVAQKDWNLISNPEGHQSLSAKHTSLQAANKVVRVCSFSFLTAAKRACALRRAGPTAGVCPGLILDAVERAAQTASPYIAWAPGGCWLTSVVELAMSCADMTAFLLSTPGCNSVLSFHFHLDLQCGLFRFHFHLQSSRKEMRLVLAVKIQFQVGKT